MTGKFEYSDEDVEKIILEHHKKAMPAPPGMKWNAVSAYNGVQIFLAVEETKNNEMARVTELES